jgi:pimeloyl-ACP methyl ester carboxylesterase
MQKTIDGLRLGYDDDGSGEALVLLHGFLFDRGVWAATAEHFAPSCRIVRMDLRGSGASECGAGPALMEALAGDLFGLLDALDVERAVVVGHGMGGFVALAFFRMYAERVAGLGLVASRSQDDDAQLQPACAQIAAALASHDVEATVGAYLAHALGPRAAADVPLVTRLRASMGRQSVTGLAAQLVGMRVRLDSGDILGDISVPTTLIAGEYDAWLSATDLEATAAAIEDCQVTRLASIGHLPMVEAPDATLAALSTLLERCGVISADRRSARADRA